MLIDESESWKIRLPVTWHMRECARVFAERQQSLEKAIQVERNTLAVSVVNAYLEWQGYATNLAAGDSWNIGTQLLGDVADLMVEGVGRIECRPVLPGEEECYLPAETWYDRVAYVVVQLNVNRNEAVLLGFSPTFDPEDPVDRLILKDLGSVDELVSYFDRIEKGYCELEKNSSLEFEKVRKIWTEHYSRLTLIAQLERIYRNELPSKWRVKGEKIISDRILESNIVRESFSSKGAEKSNNGNRIELQSVAEKLLNCLVEVWR